MSTAEQIRLRLDHPVIDADGHMIEFLPAVRDLVVEEAGESRARSFDVLTRSASLIREMTPEQLRAAKLYRTPWWGLPARNTLDRVTAMLPDLLSQRLDRLGIDYAVVYPTYGLSATAIPDDELRTLLARAFNRFMADAWFGHRDRIEPVAAIPCATPAEAIAELDHAVGELGFKAVMMAGVMVQDGRAVPIGHDADHDFEPLWERCSELKVAPTFHGPGFGWGSRVSTTSYVYNHVGSFAAAGEATARSLLFGGVPLRHPALRFCFCEGGVGWAAQLYADVVGHYEKRNAEAIESLDPLSLDQDELVALFARHATGPIASRLDRLGDGLAMLSDPDDGRGPEWDEFAASGITSVDDVRQVFTEQFFFGCEADDPLNTVAFAEGMNPLRARLPAMFASDIGHWDVPDASGVLPEAWELVERGLLTEGDFADFACNNAVRLWAGVDPTFFDGTAVAGVVAEALA